MNEEKVKEKKEIRKDSYHEKLDKMWGGLRDLIKKKYTSDLPFISVKAKNSLLNCY